MHMPFRTRLSLPWTQARCTKLVGPWTQRRQLERYSPAKTRKPSNAKLWPAERLQPSPKYPLTTKLRVKLDPRLDDKYGKRTTYLRPQIVSPDLCDDVLSYIGPSLQKYKGCDILDLNPGAGLWSSKLHEFLQPRSHILLESEPDKFQYFLDPLVNKPGSNYKLVTGNVCAWDTFDGRLDEWLPHQKRVTPGDPNAQESNNSLLVTGTLMWEPMLPGLSFDSMGKQMLMAFNNLSWRNAVFHAFGPARMLLWTTTHDLRSCLPRAQLHVGKSSLYMQKTGDITEVASPGYQPRTAGKGQISGREARYDLESVALALKKMKDSGVELPAHRRENVHDFAEEILDISNGTGIITAAECDRYLREQERSGKSVAGLITEFFRLTWQLEKELGWEPGMKLKAAKDEGFIGDENLAKGPEFRAKWMKLSKNRANSERLLRERAVRDQTADLGEAIYLLECKILGMKEGEAKQTELRNLKEMDLEFDERFGEASANFASQILSDIDDRICLRTPVTRLLWDQRSYEPLVVKEDEFWPSIRASLSDIVPRPIPKGQTAESFDYFQDFTSALCFMITAPLPEALEYVQPGASELIDQVPILRDPRRGGRLDLNKMRVRMLTVEMIDELCKAYYDWPFRYEDANHPRYFQMKRGKGSKYQTT